MESIKTSITVPPPSNPTTSDRKNIHTHFTNKTIEQLDHSDILQTCPPDVHSSEETLGRVDRVHLARLRSGHHPALRTYQLRFNLGSVTDDTCPNCGMGSHNILHLMEHCTTHTALRHEQHINGIRDLWDNPTGAIAYMRSTGLFDQAD